MLIFALQWIDNIFPVGFVRSFPLEVYGYFRLSHKSRELVKLEC